MVWMIPIARPHVGDPEIENVVHVLRSGMLAGGEVRQIRHLRLSVLAHTIIVRTAEERNQTQMSAAPKASFETAGRRRNIKTHWQGKRDLKYVLK